MQLLLLLGLAGLAAANPCNPDCRFQFCANTFDWTVGLPDRPFTGKICLNGVRIGPGVQTGEAWIGTLPAKRLSRAALPKLSQPFSPDFVRGITDKSGSALAHQTPQGNQADYLNELCMRVPIMKYSIKVGGMYENRKGGKHTDCIGLTTELPDPIPQAPARAGLPPAQAAPAPPAPAANGPAQTATGPAQPAPEPAQPVTVPAAIATEPSPPAPEPVQAAPMPAQAATGPAQRAPEPAQGGPVPRTGGPARAGLPPSQVGPATPAPTTPAPVAPASLGPMPSSTPLEQIVTAIPVPTDSPLMMEPLVSAGPVVV